MSSTDNGLFAALQDIHGRPAPFSACTAEALWNDPHIPQPMLAFHLDASSAPASRPHDFIDRSAAWISERFELERKIAILDYGCGPGRKHVSWPT